MQPDFVRALSRAWASINAGLFGGALIEPPTIEIADDRRRSLGQWDPFTRTIRFSATHVMTHPWWSVVETLKHEMAHQYVSDVLGIEHEETAHGPAFRMVCDRYGIDGRAAHKPTEEEQRIIDKARKLLALTASPNEHEAQAALAAAQRLLGQHGLAEADLRDGDGDEFGALVIGPILPQIALHHRHLATLLSEMLGVRPIFVTAVDPRTSEHGCQLEVVGRRRDLAMAEYVHGWMLRVAEQLCPADLKGKRRLDFLAGVVDGHRRRLREERAAEQERKDYGLMRARHDERLGDYFDRRHPRTRALRGSRRRLSDSYVEGHVAGRNVRMQKPMANAGPKLLAR